MNGIQFVTDDKGRNTAVLINLEKARAALQDSWDGLDPRRSKNLK